MADGPERSLGSELRRLLEEADAQWTLLEHRLAQAQEETIQQYAEDLLRFGLRPEELQTSDGFASRVQGRVHSVLLCPIAADMRNQVWPDLSDGKAEPQEQLVLDYLLDRWEFEVEPLLGEAAQQDARLARRAKRKAQRGSTREALQATKERPAVWATARAALEAMEGHVRGVSAFMAQVSEAAERIAAAVPAVVARAAVDWHFRGPLAELEQLEQWWDGARQALQSRQELWDRLVQEEGIFLRRIDRGVEALRSARQTYVTHAAFGNSESCGWPADALQVLSQAAEDMTSRLRPVRDSAAWRVVDAAKAIEKELSQVKETWSISEREAAQLILKVLGGVENEDVLLHRAAKLMTLLTELRETFTKDDLAKVLEDLLRAVVALREDLSVDPEGLDDCVQRWHALGEACNAAERLEVSVQKAPQLRKLPKQLALLRGLHVLLQRRDLRARLISEDGYESSECHQGRETREVCHPPSPTPAQHSPRGGYAPRRPRFKAEDTGGYSIDSSPSAPALETPVPPLEVREVRRSRPSTAGRPSTPSWLRPPWQRSDTPLASWTRPDTPSTVCDDAEVANLPRWKVVDGDYVPLKSAQRLPPLKAK